MDPVTKQTLADRRAAEHSKNLAEQMEMRAMAIDQIGTRLGAPVELDPLPKPPPAPKVGTTKSPPRNPHTVPRPPELTRAEEEQLTREEAEQERQQHVSAVRDSKTVGHQNHDHLPKREKLQNKKPAHPLLTQLRHEFGIGSDQKPPIDVRVADHVWTFVPLTPDFIALAARVGDSLSETTGEHALRTKQAAVCFAIVAVDSVPVWLMFGLEPGPNDNVDFPLLPKGPIRQSAAVLLYSELTGGLKNRLLEALYEAYVAKIDTDGSVASYMTYEKLDHVVWLCGTDECQYRIVRPRRYEGDQELPYYCELHGTMLIDISTTKPRIDEDLRPLV